MKTEKIQHRLPTEQEIESELERVRDNRRYRSALASTIRIIVTAAAISVLIATFLLSALQVQGSSMSPTLENGQIVLVFQKNELQQGELTAFYYGEKLLIKRCWTSLMLPKNRRAKVILNFLIRCLKTVGL